MKKKWLLLFALAVVSSAVAFYFLKPKKVSFEEVVVVSESFEVTVSAAGTVSPENRVSITSPIAGRIDRILVEEGARVRKGQVLSWMSSTDRAALLDSAKVQGEAAMQELLEVYKPTPILSPSIGTIIAKNIVAGQTVSQSNVLFELSDRLVIVADVDETDLGKITLGQLARVTVDSFPGLVVQSRVARIAHQSKTKNSINVYEVLLLPEQVPTEFRSGLTASVQFVYQVKETALLLPTWVAEGRENVELEFLRKGIDGKSQQQKVRLGFSNGQKIEILQGLDSGDIVLVQSQNYLSENVPGTVIGVGGGSRRGRR